MSVTQDDYGTSYYYRGGVKDNYLNYSGMCWRIVRIEGDGSIKLILADPEGVCSTNSTTLDEDSAVLGSADFGYDDSVVPDYNNNNNNRTSSLKYVLNQFFMGEVFTEHFSNNEMQFNPIDQSKLKEEEWCLGNLNNGYDFSNGNLLTGSVTDLVSNNINFYYEAGKRIINEEKVTLECEGQIYESKIGTLTVDEIIFAGDKYNTRSIECYLNENANSSYYSAWWTLSPASFRGYGSAFSVSSIISENYVDDSYGFRPSITLVNGTEVLTGNGTIENPYVINMS